MNNVETLFNVLEVLPRRRRRVRRDRHRRTRRARGSSASPAASSGPGLYELPFGATLRELLDLAGRRPPKAVLLGGAAGAFVGPDLLDLQLTYEDTRAAGVTLGSGVVIVYDESADLVPALLRIAEFFRDESCGQCVPCRVGTVRQEEALHRLAAGGRTRTSCATLGRARAGDARRVDLRPRPDGGERGRVGDREPEGVRGMTQRCSPRRRR